MNKHFAGIAGAVALAFLAVGCGSSSSSSSGTGSCLLTQSSVVLLCVGFDYSGSSSDQSALTSECQTAGLTFQAQACSTTNAVAGHCNVPQATLNSEGVTTSVSNVEAIFYTTANFTPATAQSTCEAAFTGGSTGGLGGTWVSG